MIRKVRFGIRTGLSLAFLLLASCSKSPGTELPIGKPVFSYKYEAVTELFISKRDPGEPWWTARVKQEGWLGPQAVTPRWIVLEAPEGANLTDRLVDGSFVRHLLDSLSTLRKTGNTLSGTDSSFGLAPEWTKLNWKVDSRNLELLLGAPASIGEGRAARIGNERLVVDGAALDMLRLITGFDRIRHRRLATWTLDDADRTQIKWFTPQGKPASSWSAERQSGDWAKPGGSAARPKMIPFKKSPDKALEGIAHLQIERFDLPKESFQQPWVIIEWLDRKDHRLVIEVDHDLRAKTSDRPEAVFQLYDGARAILSTGNFEN
ncbi:MAG: hypothetical protein KGQ59_04935 [Bdellovibrionales bacterium]|nr:hypothetical protein [Bdellovibrionales bacterium]